MTILGIILLAAVLLAAASIASKRWSRQLRPLGILVLIVLLPLILVLGSSVTSTIQQAFGGVGL